MTIFVQSSTAFTIVELLVVVVVIGAYSYPFVNNSWSPVNPVEIETYAC